jgi:hypothetical protein
MRSAASFSAPRWPGIDNRRSASAIGSPLRTESARPRANASM